jgi:cellulose synthase/poly-beta-1,6-N-acetylglucosamine synthase-like glycosyltransferase
MIEQKKRIGEFLIERGKIEPQDLEIALAIQSKCGSKVGEILQAQGKISAYKFYIELAEFLNTPFVDLEKYNVNTELLKPESRQDYYENDYIPFDVDDISGATYIATTNPTTELLLHLTKTYFQYKVFITSPFDILWTLQKKFKTEDDTHSREEINNQLPKISAKNLTFSRQLISALFLILVACILGLQNHYFLSFVLLAINLFFFATLFSKALFFIAGVFAKKSAVKNIDDLLANINEKDLPIYTILVPLYKEKLSTVTQLTSAIKNFNYPLSKLDVKLIAELDDDLTIQNIKSLGLESIFQIIRVPHSIPKTKPKACNYALRFAKGELVTIYDAEDVPDVNQLKKTFLTFKELGDFGSKKITALQCHLNFYNRNENWLTKFFSIEYSSWFQFLLYGLQALKLPIPLGGTSNHFKTEELKNLKAWDPYNVTEDAELGMRIAINNGIIRVVNSTTMEECPNLVSSWLHQRTRWIKGHLQTFLVYMREPKTIIKNFGFSGFLGFFFFIGAPAISYIFVPFSLVLYFFASIAPNISPDLLYFMVFNLIFGVTLHLLIALFVIVKNKWLNILPLCFLFPIYWLLHSVASYLALYQLIKKPHHWNKTEHGVSKFKPELDI